MGLKLFSDEDPLQIIKKAILQHEDTFRHQVHELHRLYWTQKNLMSSSFCNDLGNFYDPSSWGHMLLPEKGSLWSRDFLPPEYSNGFFSSLYQDRKRRFDFQLSPNKNGTNEHFLECSETAVDPKLELTLGILDGNSSGKRSAAKGIPYSKDYFKRQEVIDLDDDSVEILGNEEGTLVTSFGPKTPTIFNEARREHKQPRLCFGNVNEKTGKYLDYGRTDNQIIAGQSTINGINQGNQFPVEQHCSSRKAALFDLNTAQPEELDDIPVCELDDVSSRAVHPSDDLYKSTYQSYAYLGSFDSELSGRPHGKGTVGITADTLNSSLTNSLAVTDSQVSVGPTSQARNSIVGSQQSSNGSSPLLLLHPCTPVGKNGLPLEQQPSCDNGANCSAMHFEGAEAQTLLGVKSETSCERREEMTSSWGTHKNQELCSGICNSNEDPLELLGLLPVGGKSRETKCADNTRSVVACEHPVLAASKDAKVWSLNPPFMGTSSHSKKPILDDCSYNSLRTQSFRDDGTCNENESAMRWPEEVDHVVLMASASLVHMSLVNSNCPGFGYDQTGEREVEEKGNERPQSSIDSLEHIVLKLPESKEVECPSPFKPVEESMVNGKCRYSSRSGRQLRDFQKDILPGIVALSRHEICEDMHAFAEIVRSDELGRKGMTANAFRRNRHMVGRSKRPRRW